MNRAEMRDDIDTEVRKIVNGDIDRLFMVASVLAPIAEDIINDPDEAEDIIVDLGATVHDS